MTTGNRARGGTGLAHDPADVLDRPRIVVGGDTTPAGSAALRWAAQEGARHDQARVVVVHAFDRTGRADLALERDLDRARRDARYRTQCWVVEVLGDAHADVPVLVHTPEAPVEDSLVAAARDALMLVIGESTSGPRGDLADRLRARVACPVVVVGAGRAASADRASAS